MPGCSLILFGAAPRPKTAEQLDAQAELLRKLITLCSDYGIVLNLHNHTNEVEYQLHDSRAVWRGFRMSSWAPT
ncbi:MAG: hypothetical protein WBQ29_00065 [Isosphaeraceae bacterium]